jgi:hypothetical protein
MIPTRASIAACAKEPLMSCRHSFWSKPIEALISCITTDGPAANRPPHCGLAASFRCFGVSLKKGPASCC